MKTIRTLRLALQVTYEGEDQPVAFVTSLQLDPLNTTFRDQLHFNLRGMLRKLVDGFDRSESMVSEPSPSPNVGHNSLKERLIRHFGYRNDSGLVPMPFGIKQYNACNDPCDALEGPCACGAWHKVSVQDWSKEMLDFIEEKLSSPQ